MGTEPDSNQKTAGGNSGASGEEFPSARYFQVHFEYLENLLNETRACLDALKRQVAAVHQGAGVDAAAVGSAGGGYALKTAQLGLPAISSTRRGPARAGTGRVKSS